jgi:hypothetical protein
VDRPPDRARQYDVLLLKQLLEDANIAQQKTPPSCESDEAFRRGDARRSGGAERRRGARR